MRIADFGLRIEMQPDTSLCDRVLTNLGLFVVRSGQ